MAKMTIPMVLVLGAAAFMAGAGVVACGGPAAPGASETTGSAVSAQDDDAKKNKDAGADVNCGTPATLHKESAAGVFCPYSSGADGGDVTCAAGELCCQAAAEDDAGVYPPSKCEKTACKGTNEISWECEGPLDCAGSKAGPVCCGYGTPEKEAPSCKNYNYVSGATGLGTVCAASCTAGTQTVICDARKGDECPSGTTCTPVKDHGNQVGYCL